MYYADRGLQIALHDADPVMLDRYHAGVVGHWCISVGWQSHDNHKCLTYSTYEGLLAVVVQVKLKELPIISSACSQ